MPCRQRLRCPPAVRWRRDGRPGPEGRVRARFVQKCTVRDGSLTVAVHFNWRSNRPQPLRTRRRTQIGGSASPCRSSRAVLASSVGGVRRRPVASGGRRGSRTQRCKEQTNVFVRHSSDMERERQNHCILGVLSRSTGSEARPLPCISARIWLVPLLHAHQSRNVSLLYRQDPQGSLNTAGEPSTPCALHCA